MNGFFVLDSLYLNVKYPFTDVFNRWYPHAENVEHRKLKEGIAIGDLVLRGGASCYKISLWKHDARAYLTDNVDEKAGEGRGAGIWLQLGPKFILHHINDLKSAVNDFLAEIGVTGSYPIHITRLDFAIDLLGFSMKDQDLSQWGKAWVGRSKISQCHFNSRTGDLETVNIGSRNSAVYLRFYDKVQQAAKDGDLEYWRDAWRGFDGPVTRIEWEIDPREGNFAPSLTDFYKFDGQALRELLIYLLDWGRMCTPSEEDSNCRRWQDAPMWLSLRELTAIWCKQITWPTSRFGKEFHGLSDGYIKFVSGTISGAMAHFNESEPGLTALFEGLEARGQSLRLLQQNAEKKAAVLRNL